MGLSVADLSARLLGFGAMTTSETNLPVGIKEALVDRIMGGLGEIREAAPGLFSFELGAVLAAPGAVNVTVAAATPTQITMAAPGVAPNDLCSVRLANAATDGRIYDINGTAAKIAPGYEAVASGSVTVGMDVWQDAWQVADGGSAVADLPSGTVVRVNGLRLDRVQGRAQAEGRWGCTQPGRRLAGVPRVWWSEVYLARTFILVYPMPGVRTAIEASVVRGFTEVTTANVLASNETFSLPDDVARDVWRPLVVQRFMGTTYFRNAESKDEITRQAQLANQWIAARRPKKPRLPDWGEGRVKRICR